MLIIYDSFMNVTHSHIMLIPHRQSKRDNPFSSVSTDFALQWYCIKTLEFHSRLTVLNLGLTSNASGLGSSPAPTVVQSN